jgi:hypothetical protein
VGDGRACEISSVSAGVEGPQAACTFVVEVGLAQESYAEGGSRENVNAVGGVVSHWTSPAKLYAV